MQRSLSTIGIHALAFSCLLWVGCTMSAPMGVLHEPRLPVPVASRVAIAPIVAKPELAKSFEQALLAQHPSTRQDMQIVASEALMQSSPIRLASTAPMTSELTALHAARQTGAEILLMGEVIQDDLGSVNGIDPDLPPEINIFRAGQLGRSLPPENLRRPERIAVAWRVVDVQTGDVVGGHTLAIDRMEADRKYPDLALIMPSGSDGVLAAGARQTWQAVTPYVEREKAVIALPWLQPGASAVRRGNAYARQGRWDMAESQWSAVAAKYPFSNAAKHNLALAYAAREDFSGAKEQLGSMNFLRSRKLQSETLVWLDQRHREHVRATGTPPPPEGFAFPASESLFDPVPGSSAEPNKATPPGPDELPLWTAIPFAKPPGWTWRNWLLQPWAL